MSQKYPAPVMTGGALNRAKTHGGRLAGVDVAIARSQYDEIAGDDDGIDLRTPGERVSRHIFEGK